MILYSSDYFGLLTLLNLNGSAAYRAFLPALSSTIILVAYRYTWGSQQVGSSLELTAHPYVITTYVLAFSLVLNFRLNYSYQRYWEAATQLFRMTSKWVDSASCLSSIHYQSCIYRPYRPTSFGKDHTTDHDDAHCSPIVATNNNNHAMSEQQQPSPPPLFRTATSESALWEPWDLTVSQTVVGQATAGFLTKWLGWSTPSPDHALPSAANNNNNNNGIMDQTQTPPPRYHRRIPSVDLPRPGTANVKAFHPTPGKAWETTPRSVQLSHIKKTSFKGGRSSGGTKSKLPNQHHPPPSSPLPIRGISSTVAVDLDSWMFGSSSSSKSSPTSMKKQSKHGRQQQPPPPPLQHPASLIVQKPNRNDHHDDDHSSGVASERIYHKSDSDRSTPTSQQNQRRSSPLFSSSILLPNWRRTSKSKPTQQNEDNDHHRHRPYLSPQNNDNDDDDPTSTNTYTTEQEGGLLPSLFLQEAAHLYSLTSAVAMASLRADLEGCASPLVEYVPGQPFPPVNPDEMKVKVWLNNNSDDDEHVPGDDHIPSRLGRQCSTNTTTSLPSKKNDKYWIPNSRVQNSVYFLLRLSRSPKQRTLYNASRPFAVMGGLSDNEVKLLQKARGPEAQMALCTLWLKEFISREHLNGSTGLVAPPIVARVFHYISDGFAQYNQCRKIAYTQFPFVHSQLTTFFLFLSIIVFPYLYYTYVNNTVLACVLNFATLACFDGMYEVARELQDPFYQFPNDLPLNNYQVQFNEALISCMYGGFHPNSKSQQKEDD